MDYLRPPFNPPLFGGLIVNTSGVCHGCGTSQAVRNAADGAPSAPGNTVRFVAGEPVTGVAASLGWLDMSPLPIRQSLRRRWRAIIAIVLLLAVLAVGGLAYFFFEFGGLVGGFPPTYSASDGDWALTHKARSAKPLINALRQYHNQHGKFPADLSQLVPLLPAGSVDQAFNNVNGWTYFPSPTSDAFDAHLRLGWDPSLIYHGTAQTGRWAFEPGDGTPEKPIALNP